MIKNYNESVNVDDLIEKLYEVCIIERFKNNVTKAVKTAMEFLKCENKLNTVYFIFCDCIDSSMIYYNYWINNILNNKNKSFIFFVEKTLSFKDEYIEVINNMWNIFKC